MKRTIIIAILLLPTLCFGAMYQAEVIVGWTGKGTSTDAFRPDIDKYRDARPAGTRFYAEDKTGQPGGSNQIKEPNLSVVYIESDNETIAKMKDDGLVVLWTQRISTEPIKPLPKQTKAELDKLKYDLTYKGFPAEAVAATAMADTSKADVTAADVSIQLRSVMKEFPAKK